MKEGGFVGWEGAMFGFDARLVTQIGLFKYRRVALGVIMFPSQRRFFTDAEEVYKILSKKFC